MIRYIIGESTLVKLSQDETGELKYNVLHVLYRQNVLHGLKFWLSLDQVDMDLGVCILVGLWTDNHLFHQYPLR